MYLEKACHVYSTVDCDWCCNISLMLVRLQQVLQYLSHACLIH